MNNPKRIDSIRKANLLKPVLDFAVAVEMATTVNVLHQGRVIDSRVAGVLIEGFCACGRCYRFLPTSWPPDRDLEYPHPLDVSLTNNIHAVSLSPREGEDMLTIIINGHTSSTLEFYAVPNPTAPQIGWRNLEVGVSDGRDANQYRFNREELLQLMRSAVGMSPDAGGEIYDHIISEGWQDIDRSKSINKLSTFDSISRKGYVQLTERNVSRDYVPNEPSISVRSSKFLKPLSGL